MERKDQLLASLEKIFTKIAEDRFIYQMFHESTSANYIPDRICEVITFYLNNDREQYILELQRKVRAYEACFGLSRAKEFEDIGNRLLENANSQGQKEEEHRKCIQELKQQLKKANEEILEQAPEDDFVIALKAQTSSIVKFQKSVKAEVEQIHRRFVNDMRTMRNRSQAEVRKLRTANYELKCEIEKLNRQLDAEKKSYRAELEYLNQEHLKDMNESRAQIEETEAKIDDLKQKVKDRQREMENDHQEEVRLLHQRVKDALQESVDLEQQNEELQRKVEEVEMTVQIKTQKNKSLKNTIERMRSSSECLFSEKDEIIENLRLQNEDMRATVEEARNAVKKMKGDVQRVTEEKEKLKLVIEKQTKDNERHKKAVGELKSSLGKTEEGISDLKKEIERLTDQNGDYKEVVKQLTHRMKAKDEHIKKLTNSNKDLKGQLISLEENVSALSDELTNARIDLHTQSQSVSISEAVSVRRDLDLHIAKLKTAENRISELMNEIQKREEEIRNLCDSLMQKETEVTQLRQTELIQSKENEKLQNITRKQEMELENARNDSLKLQQEYLSLQSKLDMVSNNSDHGLQDNCFDGERDKYRVEIARLQKLITDQSLKVTDLQRTVDQLIFERNALTQLVQDKENEVMFVRNRTEKDLEEIRGTVLKTLEENGDLKRKQFEAEEMNRSLVRQLDDVESVGDIPKKMWYLRQENASLLSKLETITNLCGDSDITGFITKIKNEHELLSDWKQKVVEACGCLDTCVPESITRIRNDWKRITEIVDSTGPDVVDIVDKMHDDLVKFETREEKILLMLDEDEPYDLPQKISTLLEENKILRDHHEHMNSIKELALEEDPDFSFSTETMGNMVKTAKRMATVSEMIKCTNDSDPIELVQKLIEDSEEHKLISEIFSDDNDGQSLPEVVRQAVETNKEMKEKLVRIEEELPESLRETEDIPKAVSALVSRVSELEQQSKILSECVNGDESLETEIKNLVEECAELRVMKQRLNEITGADEHEDIIAKAKEATSTLTKIQEELGDRDIVSHISLVNTVIMKLMETCDEQEESTLVDRVSNIISDSNTVNNLLMDCLKVVSSSETAEPGMFMSEKVRQRILSIFEEFKKQLDESSETIITIINKARRVGYTEKTDALAAVAFLEDVAAFNAAQKCSETMHEEVSALRRINSEQQAVAAKQRDKYKEMIACARDSISELQEKVNQMEEEHGDCAIESQRAIAEAQEATLMEKRVIEEILRLFAGEVWDAEFVSSRLGSKHAMMLKRAKAKTGL